MNPLSGVCVIVLISVAMSYPQRSAYAPRPVGYADVLPRFLDEAAGNDTSSRLGEDTSKPENLPPLDEVQASFNNRFASWPKEHQPFVYLNAQHIASHINQTSNRNAIPSELPKSPFAAGSRRQNN